MQVKAILTCIALAIYTAGLPAISTAQGSDQKAAPPAPTPEPTVILEAPKKPDLSPTSKDIKLVPPHGPFMVTGDIINVRDLPAVSGKRIGQVAMGYMVEVKGTVEGGDWYAIEYPNTPIAYVNREHLVPYVSAKLDRPLRGKLVIGERICNYSIRYNGTDSPDDPVMRIADFWVDVRCFGERHVFDIPLYMFFTEIPYNFDTPAVYQVGLELYNLDLGVEGGLFVNTLFDRDKKILQFDSAGPETHAIPPVPADYPAYTVSEALRLTVTMALNALTETTWTAMRRP
ncbi:MAG: SH3 domain-containing protein [Magnetospiraceae bacterium]